MFIPTSRRDALWKLLRYVQTWMSHAVRDMLAAMKVLSAFMIIVLVLATGLRAGPTAGCMEDAPAMGMSDVTGMTTAVGMADDSQTDAERTCDDTGKASTDAVTICHGVCVAPMMAVDIVQTYATPMMFAALPGVMEWRDTTVSPDPHPPRLISHI